ncbi:hypothetical protein [Actibacterium lipolyticum]|uniref:Uncharacterized protein n=1 Tax=Actibacterium lipolyticum TaxID=1524263 RepID=A0A238JMZ6_9RHOB|nr:hypothetical protein [Actibacterium lipolyticum]SMX32039.1 hypothetical protein COL8621_00691 [Actibacterium lipolyticum]
MFQYPPFPFPGWTTDFNAPFSGDVVQTIEPRVFSPSIAGDAEIEERIHMNVASYGTQLGKILRALDILGKATGTDLPEIDKLIASVNAEKAEARGTLRAEAEAALERLKRVDPDAWAEVTGA